MAVAGCFDCHSSGHIQIDEEWSTCSQTIRRANSCVPYHGALKHHREQLGVGVSPCLATEGRADGIGRRDLGIRDVHRLAVACLTLRKDRRHGSQ